jgi:hypothetical protein
MAEEWRAGTQEKKYFFVEHIGIGDGLPFCLRQAIFLMRIGTTE